MSITCAACGYDRNPPNVTECEVCGSPLGATSQPQPSVSPENLSSETPQYLQQIPTADLSSSVDNFLRSQYSDPPPTINIQPPGRSQYSDPPPTIDIKPPGRSQYSDPPPTIDIQPPGRSQYSDPPPTIDIKPPGRSQYSDPPPTIDIQPPGRSQYSDPPPTIDIQPPGRSQYSDPPPTIDIQPPGRSQYSDPPPTINIQPPPSSQTNSPLSTPSMNITCPQCGYDRNPPGTEFCDVCGYEFTPAPVESGYISEPTKIQEEPLTLPPVIQPPEPKPPILNIPIASSTAKLIAKQTDSQITEFVLEESNIIGRFDPDLGPVEIDLEGFVGADYISRNHAEIYKEAGQWKIKDLGSENGVFLKRPGQTRFSPRITQPEILNSGDEIAFAKIRFLFQSL